MVWREDEDDLVDKYNVQNWKLKRFDHELQQNENILSKLPIFCPNFFTKFSCLYRVYERLGGIMHISSCLTVRLRKSQQNQTKVVNKVKTNIWSCYENLKQTVDNTSIRPAVTTEFSIKTYTDWRLSVKKGCINEKVKKKRGMFWGLKITLRKSVNIVVHAIYVVALQSVRR